MNGTTLLIKNNEYHSEYIQRAFYLFLSSTKPNIKPRTISTYCSDAFFILEKLPQRWVTSIISDESTDESELKKRLYDIIRRDITATRSCPDKDAKSYTRNFWNLILFLRIICLVDEGKMPRRIRSDVRGDT